MKGAQLALQRSLGHLPHTRPWAAMGTALPLMTGVHQRVAGLQGLDNELGHDGLLRRMGETKRPGCDVSQAA
jgi:hypothetical protein